jgi:hypothetical protein
MTRVDFLESSTVYAGKWTGLSNPEYYYSPKDGARAHILQMSQVSLLSFSSEPTISST